MKPVNSIAIKNTNRLQDAIRHNNLARKLVSEFCFSSAAADDELGVAINKLNEATEYLRKAVKMHNEFYDNQLYVDQTLMSDDIEG